jgi:hypothetical protein
MCQLRRNLAITSTSLQITLGAFGISTQRLVTFVLKFVLQFLSPFFLTLSLTFCAPCFEQRKGWVRLLLSAKLSLRPTTCDKGQKCWPSFLPLKL